MRAGAAPQTCWDLVRTQFTVELGGICANKTGYHDERNGQLGNYSARLALDLLGPGDTCSAVDLTIRNKAEMIKRCTLLGEACNNEADERTIYIREWIGTLNGTNVHCQIHNTEQGAFWWDNGRDSSHLWHIHISFFRKWSDEKIAGEAIASILTGETYAAWRVRKGLNATNTACNPKAVYKAGSRVLREGMCGTDVALLQRFIGVSPADGIFGPITKAKVEAYQRMRGYSVDGIVGPQTWGPILASLG